MQDAVPLKVLEMGERNQLGEFVRCHRGPMFFSLIWGDFIGALVMSAILGLIAASINLPIFTIGLHRVFLTDFFSWFLFAFFLCEAQPLLITCINGKWKQRIYEFANGYVLTKKRVRKMGSVQWEALSTLTYKGVSPNTGNAEFQVATSSNKIYGLHCRTLIPSIKQKIIDKTLPDMLARYEAGETLTFTETRVRGAIKDEIARVCISQDGICIRRGRKQPDEEINWSDLVAVTEQGNFMLKLMKRTSDKPVRISLYDITNGCVLKALLLTILSSINKAHYQQIQIAE